jgi:Calcineurin-like phosphoesterase
MTTHAIIPDVQAKPGQNFDFLEWAGKYLAEKKPDKIICIGDFADMPSLSSYDVGKREYEGRRYVADIEASYTAMETLLKPIFQEQVWLERNHKKRWNPELHMFLGNHEDRITRACNLDPKLDGLIGVKDLQYESFGWKVYPFLEVGILDGIAYSHYFVTGVMGRPVTSARQLVIKKHMSCTMGHHQSMDICMSERRGDGHPIIGLFAGVYNDHDEGYLTPQSQPLHRQIWMKYEVKDGFYFPHAISLEFLRKRYGQCKQA